MLRLRLRNTATPGGISRISHALKLAHFNEGNFVMLDLASDLSFILELWIYTPSSALVEEYLRSILLSPTIREYAGHPKKGCLAR